MRGTEAWETPDLSGFAFSVTCAGTQHTLSEAATAPVELQGRSACVRGVGVAPLPVDGGVDDAVAHHLRQQQRPVDVELRVAQNRVEHPAHLKGEETS